MVAKIQAKKQQIENSQLDSPNKMKKKLKGIFKAATQKKKHKKKKQYLEMEQSK